MTREERSDYWRNLVYQQTGSGIRIHLDNELHIEIDRGFDPVTLRTVIEAVGARKPCLP